MKETKEVWATAQYIDENGVLTVFSKYKVSNLGRVMSFCRKKPKELPQLVNRRPNGDYLYVALSARKKYRLGVHRLAMSSFRPEGYFEGAVVDYINSNPSDNRLSNLRWFTYQQNNSTPHCIEARSKAHTNHPSKSKRVKVTFLDDGHYEIFPSTREAARVLGLPSCTAATYINRCNGFYGRLNLLFEYA